MTFLNSLLDKRQQAYLEALYIIDLATEGSQRSEAYWTSSNWYPYHTKHPASLLGELLLQDNLVDHNSVTTWLTLESQQLVQHRYTVTSVGKYAMEIRLTSHGHALLRHVLDVGDTQNTLLPFQP